MKRSEWNEKQLEEKLKQLPKVKDYRPPQDIYQNVKTKMKVKNRRQWIMPIISTFSAVLLLFILVKKHRNS